MSLAESLSFRVTLSGRDAVRFRAMVQRSRRRPATIIRTAIRLGYVDPAAALLERQADLEVEATPPAIEAES